MPLRGLLGGRAAFGVTRGVAILVADLGEWTEEVAETIFRETMSVSGGELHNLLRVHPVPNAKMRRVLADLQAEHSPVIAGGRRMAIVTDSSLMRGAMTAFRWFTGDDVQGFSSTDVENASAWVADGVDGDAAAVFAMFRDAEQRVHASEDFAGSHLAHPQD